MFRRETIDAHLVMILRVLFTAFGVFMVHATIDSIVNLNVKPVLEIVVHSFLLPAISLIASVACFVLSISLGDPVADTCLAEPRYVIHLRRIALISGLLIVGVYWSTKTFVLFCL